MIQIIILAIIQGLAELLPVSSSTHVILAQKLMGLDPSNPAMTFFLVMLHTGTMFAVILYFGKRWKKLFLDMKNSKHYFTLLIIATGITGFIGLGLKIFIEKIIFEKILGHNHGEVENLFRIVPLIAFALLAVGIFIVIAGLKKQKEVMRSTVTKRDSVIIGLVQGLCLPFRGFSRSGATISTGLLLGITREMAEEFSFALAVVLTPAVIVLELKRLVHYTQEGNLDLMPLLTPGLIGMVFSFLAGLVALKWLSSWLEKGRWHYFGYYCIFLSTVTFISYLVF
jgi:undecaprenyl-diphosphatase